jgi:mono/diheme cytochrome c family protein
MKLHEAAQPNCSAQVGRPRSQWMAALSGDDISRLIKMGDDDVLAIRAYLPTVTPVRNEVNSKPLPFPLNIRLAMVFWNTLNFTAGRYQPNPQKSAERNRGAYIVEGAAYCGTCHRSKTLLGGDKNGMALFGATLQVCARHHQ